LKAAAHRIARRCAAAAVVASMAITAAAHADPPPQATELFAQGRKLRLGGECTAAEAVFRRALEVYPAGLGSLRNIAECQEATGRYASARKTWLDLKHAVSESPSPRYEGWERDADAAADRLRAEVANLLIDLKAVGPQGASIGAVEVTVNGEPIDRLRLGAPIESDPGPYLVRVVGSDGHILEQRVELKTGQSVRMSFNVQVSAERALPVTTPASTTAHWNPSTVGWVAVGLGGASLVGAGVSFAFYLSAHDALERRCPNYETQACDPSLRPEVSEGRTASTLVNVLTTAGLVGVVGGAVLVAVLSPHSSSTSLMVSPTGLWVRGSF
jgi:hypothetical protein